MPRLFVTRAQLAGSSLELRGAQAHHLAGALRARPGELLRVVDDSGWEHGVRLVSVESGRVRGEVLWSREAAGEARVRIHVIQALVREMDGIIAAVTEVGAASIHPVLSRRSVSRPDEGRAARRGQHWREVARGSAELSHRGRVPEVHALTDLEGALTELPPRTCLLACVPEAPRGLVDVDPGAAPDWAVVVGPEGGLDPAELDLLRESGAGMVHLGPRVLPASRAAAFAVGLLLARAGDLDRPAPPPPEGAP